MATSLSPELDNVVIAGGGTQQIALAIRSRCEILRGILELERASFLAQWKEIASFILPRRPRFSITDVNKGDRRNQQIIDSTATEAVGVLAAGLMAGITGNRARMFGKHDVQSWRREARNVSSFRSGGEKRGLGGGCCATRKHAVAQTGRSASGSDHFKLQFIGVKRGIYGFKMRDLQKNILRVSRFQTSHLRKAEDRSHGFVCLTYRFGFASHAWPGPEARPRRNAESRDGNNDGM